MKLWVLACLCLFLTPTYAQINSSLVLPSPNNRFLGNTVAMAATSDVGVDLYTGSLYANVPICQLTAKDINIPVTLTYVGGKGIKVQDYASQAGLGWIVNAGGSVTRVVRAFPDDQYNGFLGTGRAGQQVAAWKQSGAALPGGFTSLPPTIDGEPDIYFIKTPFFSFQFTFDENGNVVTSNNTGVKIIANNFYNTSNSYNSSFEAIDENGTHYYFGSTSASKENTSTTIFGTSTGGTTTWHLDKIVTFNNKDIATFEYISSPGSTTLNHYVGVVTWDMYGNQNWDTTHPATATVSPRYISKITAGNGTVNFNYAFDRADDPGAGRLTSIVQSRFTRYSQPVTLSTYTLNQSYFGGSSSDGGLLRLRLDGIKVTGNTTTTSSPITLRTFTYNEAHAIANRKAYAQVDLWGYQNYYPPKAYNAFPNNDRNPDLAGTLLGVLTGVTELNGGSWNVTYELNEYNNSGANKTVGGLRVKRLAKTLPTGESVYQDYSYRDNNNLSTGQIFSPSYSIIGYNWGGAIFQVLSECPSLVYDLNGNFVGYSAVKVTEKNGGYAVSTYSNFSDFPDILNYLNSGVQGSVPDVTSSTSYAFKRGMPLSVTVYDAAGNKLTEDLTPLTAYQSLTSPGGQKAWGYKWNTVSFAVGGTSGSNSYNSIYFTPYENYQLTRVIHREYDQLRPGSYIETTTSFTFSPANLRQIKTITSTDSKGKSLVKTLYHPQDTDIPRLAAGEQTVVTALANANNLSAVVHETESRNGISREIHNTFSPMQVGIDQYIYLTKSDLYMGNKAVKKKLYTYDPSTSNVSGEKVEGGKATSYQYAYGGNLPVAVIDNAEDNFTVSTQQTAAYGSLWLNTGPTTATFRNEAAGNIVISAMSSPGETVSVYYSVSGPSNASGTVCASRSSVTCSYPESVTLPNMPAGTYIISISSGGGSATYRGLSYSYNIIKPIFTATRGFYFEGFEDNPNFSATAGSAHSGSYYYNFSTPFNVNFPLPDARKYILQYWSWENGKWVMKQQNYTGPLNLSGIIDDVRVFPADALLSTFSHHSQVGRTAETDPSGKTTTYEYDGLGRLSIVRDDDNNIVSKTCVNYYGGPTGCPDNQEYSNAAYTQTFTRNNCPAGYAPGSVAYTVNAGTYTSTISQEDANQLAVNDAMLKGQAYANANGTCTLIYYSVAKSGTYTRNNCQPGFTGSSVTYTVPAGRYQSLTSQADADQQAVNDVNNNGQTYANNNGQCTTSQVIKYGSMNASSSNSVTITTTLAGDINLSVYGEPGYYYSVYYTVSGAASRNGSLCASRTSTTCSSPSSITLSNMPAGTYTISISPTGGNSPYRTFGYSYWGAP
ncbi:DUF5977 domain-containing protein [Chitinophaga solisilvae]|uniref:DUF5977 domain-containing protein n=1 Tax=Chitinophaga solisilvae TaxID=1233460 RepID=UPI001368D0A5|nr:DUF5977 domain-containing protein [Chitinophaga solisilvae]